jgi:CRP-like cAMP-binding protein
MPQRPGLIEPGGATAAPDPSRSEMMTGMDRSGPDTAMRRHALWIARAMARTDLTPLHPSDIEHLERVVRVRNEPQGTVLINAGTTVEAVFVVRSGEVRLATRRPLGGRQLVGLIREGGVVGDIPMFCERPMPFDALTGQQTTILEISRQQLLALLTQSPSLALRWMTSLAKRLEQTQHRMVSLLTKDLTMQVALLLLDEREQGSGDTWVVRLSHGTIAQLLGVRRQSVSRVLATLRSDGLVTSGYRTIVLRDLAGLAKVAGVTATDAAQRAARGGPPV